MTNPTTRVPPSSRAVLRARGAGRSHIGCVRDANEDAILAERTGALWAVTDGMGGHGHGDVAADIVIRYLARVPAGSEPRALVDALHAANAAVRARAQAEGISVMGATVVAALFKPGGASLAWAGDSRAYRLRGGALELMTRDHSLVQMLVDQRRISAADATSHPDRNVVTRAVGASEELEIEQRFVDLAPGDVLLLCSDGLSNVLAEAEIASILSSSLHPEAACDRLVEVTLTRGAPDNVSVVVVIIDGGGPP